MLLALFHGGRIDCVSCTHTNVQEVDAVTTIDCDDDKRAGGGRSDHN